MNTLRRWLGVIAAIAFAVSASSALAQNVKKFTVGAPSPVAVTTTTIQVTFTNLETGNSSFNSLGIKATMAGGSVSITGMTALSPFGPGTQVNVNDGYLYLTSLSPVKKGDTVKVNLTVQITGSSCSSGTISWIGRAFTGSPSQPSTEFVQQNSPTTTVTMGCSYSISGTDSIAKGTSKALKITVNNAAGSPTTISSVTLSPPTGLTAPASNVAYPVSIGAGTSGDINVNATASCAAGSGGSWTSAIAGFTRTGSEPSTSITGACSVVFTTVPTSVVAGTAFNVVVTVKDGAGNAMAGYGGSVTLVLTGSGCTLGGTSSGNASGGVATINGVVLDVLSNDVSSCTLKATANIDGADFASVPLALKVFDGVLACTSTPFDALDMPATGPGSFDASEGGATGPGDTGYFNGVRGSDPDKGVCLDANGAVKVNYAVVNNIPSGGSTQSDPLGNTVVVGTYSVTWDANQTDGSGNLLKPVFAVLVTQQGEWGAAATGLPTHQTLVCTASPCTTAPIDGSGNINTGWKAAPACLSTMVKHSSLPTGEKVCLASERWDVVPTSECAAAGSPPTGAVPPGGRCLKPTSILIMGDDPVVGRGGGGSS